MPVSWKDFILAFEFVSSNPGEHQAFLCKQTGKLYWQSDSSDELDELPDDIDDEEKYVCASAISGNSEVGEKPLSADASKA